MGRYLDVAQKVLTHKEKGHGPKEVEANEQGFRHSAEVGVPSPPRHRCGEIDVFWAEDPVMQVLIGWFRDEPFFRPTPWTLDDGRVIEDKWPFLFGLWDQVLRGPEDPGASRLKETLRQLFKFFMLPRHPLRVSRRDQTEGRCPFWMRPDSSCFACGGRRAWRSIHDIVICVICHPPASPELVAGWIGENVPV